ncbi:MAG: phytanoyl-CoA dioxygenase family protein [Pseudobacter sp.]|uniref:phytanoyl-CoA dioxygenase family protein n=1 Tax=Pseudobacter sp. TaxID=2045420 RepID=UPI003F809705
MQDQLSPEQIKQFIEQGFVRVDEAFPAALAASIREILWKEIGLSPDMPEAWKQPVIRLGYYSAGPFVEAANTPILLNAFDQLVGKDRWVPCRNMGSMVLRFPSDEIPNDTGWHVDVAFPGEDPNDYLSWRSNIYSKGRGLLMLFLFSDVGPKDAPTRILAGSHLDVANMLQPFGEAGLSFMEIAGRLGDLPARKEFLATGKAGTVYLCHPFLVHAAQSHTGTAPRFLAQPPLLIRGDLNIYDENNGYVYTPIEQAIRLGLKQA